MAIRYTTRAELEATVLRVLGEYPWMATYPVACHASCAGWDIEDDYGSDAHQAWVDLDNALWLLGAGRAGVAVEST